MGNTGRRREREHGGESPAVRQQTSPAHPARAGSRETSRTCRYQEAQHRYFPHWRPAGQVMRPASGRNTVREGPRPACGRCPSSRGWSARVLMASPFSGVVSPGWPPIGGAASPAWRSRSTPGYPIVFRLLNGNELRCEAAGALAASTLNGRYVRLPRDAGRGYGPTSRGVAVLCCGYAGWLGEPPGAAAARPLPLLRVAGTGAVPGSGVWAGCPLRMSVA